MVVEKTEYKLRDSRIKKMLLINPLYTLMHDFYILYFFFSLGYKTLLRMILPLVVEIQDQSIY